MASIFTTETPGAGNVSDSTQYTLGLEWTSDSNGTWTGIRVFTPTSAPASAYQVVGYSVSTSTTGTEIARGTASWASGGVWQTINFATPVAITAGAHYVASYVTPDFFVLTSHGNDSATVNGHLTAFAAGTSGAFNGRIHVAGDAFPETQASSNANYFADPIVNFTTVVSGSAALTLGPLTLTAAGTASNHTVAGSAALSLGPLTLTAVGTVSAGSGGSTAKFLFTPPQRKQIVTMEGNLRVSYPVSSTVWKDSSGVWRSQETPSADVFLTAQHVLSVSGRPQTVDQATATELIAAGVGTVVPL